MIASVEYERTDQAQVYVSGLLEEIFNRFGDLSLPGGFSIIVSDTDVANLLEERWQESLKTQRAGAYLATAILLGSILEGILLDVAQSHLEEIYKCKSAPKYKESGDTKPLNEWGLENYIDVARECGWLEDSTKYDAKIVREYRNLVHPKKQKESGVYPKDKTCNLLRSVLEEVVEDLKDYARDGKQPRS